MLIWEVVETILSAGDLERREIPMLLCIVAGAALAFTLLCCAPRLDLDADAAMLLAVGTFVLPPAIAFLFTYRTRC